MAVLVILNAGSGAGRRPTLGVEDVRALFADAGVEAEIVVPSGDAIAGLAVEAARAGPARWAAVVAAGGDGTVGTVAGALADTPMPMGVLALGTFNHFARDAGLPLDPAEGARVIAAGLARPVDVAEVNGRVFVNNSSIGLYPFLVAQRVREQRRRGWSKVLATIPALWRTLRTGTWLSLHVSAAGLRGPVRTPCFFVGNNLYDPARLGARARIDGGELGVWIVKRQSRLGLLALPLIVALGRTHPERDLEVATCARVTVAARRRRLRVSLDGETAKLATPLVYRSRPGALRLLVPA